MLTGAQKPMRRRRVSMRPKLLVERLSAEGSRRPTRPRSESRSDKKTTLANLRETMKRLVVAFGGGVNSTAMLVEMHKRGIIPDLILFSDTGGGRPENYRTAWLVSEWC